MATRNNNSSGGRGMDKKLDKNTDAAERVKALAAFANTVEVDFNVPIRR